jgi:hypothetical protein
MAHLWPQEPAQPTVHSCQRQNLVAEVCVTSYLEYLAFAEIRIGEQRRKLLTSLDRPVILGRKAWPKNLGKPTVVPNGDLVIRSVKAMDQTLDRISIVVQDESTSQISHALEHQVGKGNKHDWLQVMSQQIRKRLHRKLQRAFARDQNVPLVFTSLLYGLERPDCSPCGVSNAAVDSLVELENPRGEVRLDNTISRSSCLSNDTITRFDELRECLRPRISSHSRYMFSTNLPKIVLRELSSSRWIDFIEGPGDVCLHCFLQWSLLERCN